MLLGILKKALGEAADAPRTFYNESFICPAERPRHVLRNTILLQRYRIGKLPLPMKPHFVAFVGLYVRLRCQFIGLLFRIRKPPSFLRGSS